MGAAVAVADFDRDGWQDFYVTEQRRGRAEPPVSQPRATARSRTSRERMGVADVNRAGTGVSMGAVWGDYDNDGYEDLFLYEWGRPELFHNDGGQRLHARHRARRPAGVGQRQHARSGSTTTATAGSICSSPATRPRRSTSGISKTTRIMPESFEYANNGGRKYLFHNRGDGRFEDVSEQVGHRLAPLDARRGAADLRGTGYPDLFLANDYGVSRAVRQRGRQAVPRGRHARPASATRRRAA